MNNEYTEYIEYTYKYYKEYDYNDSKREDKRDELFIKIINNQEYFNQLKNNDDFLTYLIKKYDFSNKSHLKFLCTNNIFLNNDNNIKYIELLISKVVYKRYMPSFEYIADIFIYFLNNIDSIDNLFENSKFEYIIKNMNNTDFNKLLYKIKVSDTFNYLLNNFIQSPKSIIILDYIKEFNIIVNFNKTISDYDYEHNYCMFPDIRTYDNYLTYYCVMHKENLALKLLDFNKEYNINYNKIDDKNMNIMMYAVKNGFNKLINKLLEYDDINYNLISNENGNIISYISNNVSDDISKIIYNKVNITDEFINIISTENMNTFMYLCRNKQEELALELLNNYNIDYNIVSNELKTNEYLHNLTKKVTPLIYICKNGMTKLFKELIKKNDINYDHFDIYNYNAFNYACESNSQDIINEFLNLYYENKIKDSIFTNVKINPYKNNVTDPSEDNYTRINDENYNAIIYLCEHKNENLALKLLEIDNVYNKHCDNEITLYTSYNLAYNYKLKKSMLKLIKHKNFDINNLFLQKLVDNHCKINTRYLEIKKAYHLLLEENNL